MNSAALAAIMTAISAVIISVIVMIRAREVQKDKELAHKLLQEQIDKVKREQKTAQQKVQEEIDKYLRKAEAGDDGDL